MVSRNFLLAGKAIFTAQNDKGEHFTFKIAMKKGDPNGQFKNDIYFAYLLTGPDNESSYTYLGVVVPGDVMTVVNRKQAPATDKARAILNYLFKVVAGVKALPVGYDLKHAGRCGRCGRTLTVPSSIDAGLGPECAQMAA